MKKRYWILLMIAASGVGVFAYNYWSYSCGRCNTDSLLTLSFPAELLIASNSLAFLALIILKVRSRKLIPSNICACGANLDMQWDFCPECGKGCNSDMFGKTL